MASDGRGPNDDVRRTGRRQQSCGRCPRPRPSSRPNSRYVARGFEQKHLVSRLHGWARDWWARGAPARGDRLTHRFECSLRLGETSDAAREVRKAEASACSPGRPRCAGRMPKKRLVAQSFPMDRPSPPASLGGLPAFTVSRVVVSPRWRAPAISSIMPGPRPKAWLGPPQHAARSAAAESLAYRLRKLYLNPNHH